jgi:elongation factor Ts
MTITAEIVKQLREKTGCGMMDCKAALSQSMGDMEKAVEFLRKKGLATAAKKADRATGQGLVESYIHLGGKIGVLIEVNCETDFVARNIEFHSLVRDLAMQVAATNPAYLDRLAVPESVIKHEKEILREQAGTEGKPEPVIEKMVEGRLSKFYAEMCLLDQPFIKDSDKSISDLVKEHIAKFGENIVVKRFTRYQMGENV